MSRETKKKIAESRLLFVEKEAGEISRTLERFVDHMDSIDESIPLEDHAAIMRAWTFLRGVQDGSLRE